MKYSACISSPGIILRVEVLLTATLDEVNILHLKVVPLFTDVAGTVRLDCIMPEDVLMTGAIPRPTMMGLYTSSPSTSHVIMIPLPAQWNRAFVPISAVTDTGLSVIISTYKGKSPGTTLVTLCCLHRYSLEASTVGLHKSRINTARLNKEASSMFNKSFMTRHRAS